MRGKIVYLNEKSETLEIKEINFDLESLRSLLNDGYIESTIVSEEFLSENIYILIDEEGKLKNLEPKIIILDKNNKMIDVVVGSVIFLSVNSSDFCGLTNKQIDFIYDYFQNSFTQVKIGNSMKKILVANY